MKLVTFQRNNTDREEIGILKDSGRILPVREAGLSYETMNDLIVNASGEEMEQLRTAPGEGIPADDVKILSPIPRPLQDILCLGLNYKEHADEAGEYSKDSFVAKTQLPVYFSKRVAWSQGPGEPIPAHEDITQRLDYETELGVIIGKDAYRVREEDVEKYIFGYTIVNDVSARDLQTGHTQWYFGKSLDGFTPMGPCIVTADEIAFPPALAIKTYVNGEERQNSRTDMLIHSITEIIVSLSRGMTIKAGTVIATGTPKGVVLGMENMVFLKDGDEVSCVIEKIGELTNTVRNSAED